MYKMMDTKYQHAKRDYISHSEDDYIVRDVVVVCVEEDMFVYIKTHQSPQRDDFLRVAKDRTQTHIFCNNFGN